MVSREALLMRHGIHELDHLFLVAEILRLVIGRAQILLLPDQSVDMRTEDSAHGRAIPVRLSAQPFVLLRRQVDGHVSISRHAADSLPLRRAYAIMPTRMVGRMTCADGRSVASTKCPCKHPNALPRLTTRIFTARRGHSWRSPSSIA